jgi:hypothetical protein
MLNQCSICRRMASVETMEDAVHSCRNRLSMRTQEVDRLCQLAAMECHQGLPDVPAWPSIDRLIGFDIWLEHTYIEPSKRYGAIYLDELARIIAASR